MATDTKPQPTMNQPKAPERQAPTPPSGNSVLDAYLAEAKAYLEAKGWVMIGYNHRGMPVWSDPVTKDRTEGLRDGPILKDKEGHEYVVKQWHVPALDVPWDTDNALLIQRNREKEVKR